MQKTMQLYTFQLFVKYFLQIATLFAYKNKDLHHFFGQILEYMPPPLPRGRSGGTTVYIYSKVNIRIRIKVIYIYLLYILLFYIRKGTLIFIKCFISVYLKNPFHITKL